ncbi:MAG TPA: rhodanese-like domain-containing protein [Candidatus Limnocylindrales bacterium]
MTTTATTAKTTGRQTAGRQTVGNLLEAARARLERLEPAAAAAAQRDGALVVDTRCAELRRATGVIPGSVHVPLSVLFWRLDETSGYADSRLADRSRQVVLVCADGYSSSLAAATLLDLGFPRATDLVGGFGAWAAAGLPVEPAPSRHGRTAGAAGR